MKVSNINKIYIIFIMMFKIGWVAAFDDLAMDLHQMSYGTGTNEPRISLTKLDDGSVTNDEQIQNNKSVSMSPQILVSFLNHIMDELIDQQFNRTLKQDNMLAMVNNKLNIRSQERQYAK